MFGLTLGEMCFIALFFEAFFYGLYSGVFAMYLKYQTSKKDSDKAQHIVFYSLCALYVLSLVIFSCDIATCIIEIQPLARKPLNLLFRIYFVQSTSFGCCDFIAQSILIYRCWIVWARNIRVVIIPSILAIAFFATWLAGSSSIYISSDSFLYPYWGSLMILLALILSLAVNALVTSLIVFRIFRVFRQVKVTSDDHILGATGGTKLRRIILILIESGMALFSIQLARVVVSVLPMEGAALGALGSIAGIHQMLNGITPTIIVVRTSMGLSFHDEKSMEEVAIGSLRFAPHPNSVPEIGSVGIVGRDTRDDDDIEVRRSDDMDIVER